MKRLTALLLTAVCAFGLSSCKEAKPAEREMVSDCAVATFEYKEDSGYKLITSEIDSLDTFDSLLLKPSGIEFDGEWLYRITFNPQKYSKNTDEIIVLFGEQCVSINGITYIAENVDYAVILNWAAAKYEFFDYELITD